MIKYVNELFDFIHEGPTPYHMVNHIKKILVNFNYTELNENEVWKLENNKGYFVIRDDASIICFKTSEKNEGFNIVASHNDSPCFKLKPNYEMCDDLYERLNTEPYGGMIASTWLDRPLSIAGRVIVKKGQVLESRLVNLSGHNVIIPNVAIHLTRNASPNDLNMQYDMLPIVGTKPEEFKAQLEKSALYEEGEEIIAHDLFLYNKEEGTTCGMNHEFIASPKLDDLECAFSSLEALLESKNNNKINVCAIFDNEEVGSGSNHGAASTFLTDTLERISLAINKDKYALYANSFLVSADNAHAIHPSQGAKSDPTNYVEMNNGVVIKYHSGLSYTTEAISSAVFKSICKDHDIPYQEYTNRSDMRGGSTLGHIALEKLSIPSVDIGLAQLAMHSSYETAGSLDIEYMVKALKFYYDSNVKCNNKTMSY